MLTACMKNISKLTTLAHINEHIDSCGCMQKVSNKHKVDCRHTHIHTHTHTEIQSKGNSYINKMKQYSLYLIKKIKHDKSSLFHKQRSLYLYSTFIFGTQIATAISAIQ